MRLCTAGFELVAVLLDDLDLARRHRPGDLLDRNNEGCREAFRNFLAVLFSRAEDDISACAHGHSGDRTSHDLAVALDFHLDRKSTRLNSSHSQISYAVFCLKKKKTTTRDSKTTTIYT